MKRFPFVGIVLLGLASSSWSVEPGPKGGPEEFKHLKFRSIGPAAGGRVSRACGVPGDPLTYYLAGAASGVWKSTDGGITWKPIFDDQPISSIGSIAVAPSDPNVVYVGSGEANIRGNVQPGNGIYKSEDAGKTWKHIWKQEGQIGQMIVHPKSADIAFAAVLGHAFGPNPERGVYRTTDGGKTWQQVLRKDADTGACAVCFDPSNPKIIFAGLWQARRRPWEMTSGGPGSGLYISRDAGDTWKQLTPRSTPRPESAKGVGNAEEDPPGKGLPDGIWGKIGLAVGADGQRVYALIEAEKGGLYRSDDGGDSWKLINGQHYLRIRPWYFTTIAVDPRNADVVYCSSLRLLKSTDGGATFKQVKGTHHVDHHDLWIDPTNPKRMIDSNDGGVDVTTNGGESWFAPPLPIAQFYHISVDNRVPYHVAGTMQDLGTASGPSNSLSSGGITLGDWYGVGGGETGFTAPDPADPNIVFAGEYGGYISRYDHRTRQARNMSIYPTNPSGHGSEDMKYRFQWTAPILVSRNANHRVIYHGGNVLFRSTDDGQTWTAISPDLTRNDKSKQKWSGGPITGDNTTAEYYCTIFATAESPKSKNILWTGSDDGMVHVTRDGGKSWTNVTKNIPGIPEWGTIVCIELSPFDAGTAYVVVDNHRMDDMRPYLWKTIDSGKSWTSLTAKLPQDIFLRVVREDPERKGVLYLGTERGVAFSIDDGATWGDLKLNLPTVAITDLKVKNNDLVVGTNGRSIWIFDDLTPVREMRTEIAKQSVVLFPVQPAIRWRYHSPVEAPLEKFKGENPPKGAVIDYWLKTKPKAPITLEILDGEGKLVRKLSSKPEPEELPEDHPETREDRPKPPVLPTEIGVNRFVWNLQHQPPELIKGAKYDGGNPKDGPWVNPGKYKLRLIVDGQTVERQIEVFSDLMLATLIASVAQPNPPRVQEGAGTGIGPLSDTQRKLMAIFREIDENLQFALQIRDDISRLSGIVNRLRSLRKQLADRNELLKDNAKAAPLIKEAKALIARLDTLEAKLHNPKAEVAYDILAQKGGAQLYSKLIFLFEFVKDADGPPTQGMREEYAEQTKELKQHEAAFKSVISEDLAKLQEGAKKLDIPGVIVPPRP